MTYKFLIYISYSYAIPIGLPLEKEILKRGYLVKWFSDLDEGKNAIPSSSSKLDHIQDVIAYQPHIVLTATDSVADFISGLKVQIFHGFNAQKRSFEKDHFRIRGFFDLYCTQGPSTTAIFNELKQKHKTFEVIETGWSKVDPLFPVTTNFKTHKTSVMIASTFTERLSLAYNDEVFNEISRLSKTGDYVFNMVLHPKIPKAIVQKWKGLSSNSFTYHDTTDLIPLFKEAQLLFADTTSAIQEFLLQEKPVVSFQNYMRHDYLIHVENPQSIEHGFKTALEKPAELMKNIKSFIEQLHPYTDGNSSKRVINATIAYLHKEKNNVRNKPINLIRKYKIRKRLNYFTLKSYNRPFKL